MTREAMMEMTLMMMLMIVVVVVVVVGNLISFLNEVIKSELALTWEPGDWFYTSDFRIKV